MIKSKADIFKEKEKKAEEIIQAAANEEKTESEMVLSSVSLDKDMKKTFQKFIGKGTGLNMSLVFNAFMKLYNQSPELRKKIAQEIILNNSKKGLD